MTLENPVQFKTMNDGADYWYYQIGVNVIPVYSKNKNKKDRFSPLPSYTEWFTKPLDETTFQSWKDQKLFDNGVAIIGGLVHRGLHAGQYLIMIDLDNQKGIDEFCRDGIKNTARHTLVEQHLDRPDKCHLYFYSIKPCKKKGSSEHPEGETDPNSIPDIEVKGEGGHGIHIVTPSIHKDGQQYQIVSEVTMPYATTESIEDKVENICKKFGIKYLELGDNGKSLIPMQTLLKDDFKIYEKQNRHEALMRYMESKRLANPEFSDDMIMKLAKDWNQKHCVPPFDDDDPAWTREFNSAKTFSIPIIQKNAELKAVDDSKKISKSKVIIDETTEIIRKELNLVTVNESQKTFLYNGKIYSESLAESRIKARTEEIIENCTTNDRNEVINKIKARTGKDLGLFDNDPNLITLDNGILNLETLELAPHTPDNLSCVLLPVEFTKPIHEINDETIFEDIEKNLSDTLFYKFLKSSFTVNGEFRKEDFEMILEAVASVMIKRNIDEKAFMFLGAGNNGKSVCMEYIRSLIGDANISNIPLQDLANDRFMGAGLAGKLANIFTDLESDEMKHTGKVKAITSGEGFMVQEKYGKPFKLFPFCKLMFSCNRFPRITDQTQGFFRRWIIVKWDRDFGKEDNVRDPLLKEKLVSNRDEKNLVASCFVYLARKLNKTGKFTHTKNWKNTQKAWNENADPLDHFVTSYTKDSDKDTPKRIMYRNYHLCMTSKGETPLGMGQFSKLFSQYYEDDVIRDDKGNKVNRCWIGVECIPFTLDEVEE